ncbi:Gfo/Idh/MocA family protein [Rugosimonospora africana]|uniref:Oxidoreductase n=1 Tax=Rugosimonospora africana TaxID=556532 RepID=A0A8J3QWP7_9ACTN|nr:Gfo/Idh/MocA family oxidoreductase [Rugosimonospora africana]GIH18529.1 oxidoreductase [Rugosimonospora africana]
MKESTAATSAQTPLRVGVLGAGGIATIPEGVLPNMHHIADKATVVAVADVLASRAEQTAARFGIPAHYSNLDDMLANSDLDAVVNLTPIPAHAETSLKIVEAGKHLVVEKPLATTLAEADAIIDAAGARELTIVCAPPDMLYSPYVQAQRLIRENAIGKVAFARVRSSHGGPGGGPDGWPFDPTWFYQDGSGPLLDMGVYGIHEITGMLGPAKRVTAFAGITEPTRVVRGDGPYGGLEIPVTTPDNCLFMLDFGDSTFAVVDGTFNVVASRSPKVEVFGRRGALALFRNDGPDLEVYRTDLAPGLDGWIAPNNWPAVADPRRAMLKRALLVDHLVDCVRDGKAPVLSAEHARHALEIMLAVFQSAREGRVVELTTTF